jgi:hypothetical protein
MFSRRTWARIVFLSNLLVLPLRVYQWRRTAGEDGESVPLALRWLVTGMGYQVAHCWAYDHDLGAIRTKRWRRILLAVVWFVLSLRAFPRSEGEYHNFSIGGTIGRISYRFWYGVLRPLPDTDE